MKKRTLLEKWWPGGKELNLSTLALATLGSLIGLFGGGWAFLELIVCAYIGYWVLALFFGQLFLIPPSPGWQSHIHCGDAVWGGTCPDPSWHSPVSIRGQRYPDGSTDYSRANGVPRRQQRPVGMEPW